MAEQWVWDPPELEVLDLHNEEDFASFIDRYFKVMEGGEALTRILEVVARGEGVRCFVERDYIDQDYRDEFANFYSKTYRPHLDRCQRLHFLTAEDGYVGYVVLRPIPGRLISRTMIAPPPELRNFITCTATEIASPHGGCFPITAAPFISQDFQYGVCAHAAIWMVAQYFHLRFGSRRLHMSDVVKATESRPGRHPMTPSRGLTAGQLCGALDSLGFLQDSYRLVNEEQRQDAEERARCYLNSGIPLILSRGRHAQVLVGYCHDEKTGDRIYLAQDDLKGPYRPVESGLQIGDLLVIPSPGRIYLDPAAAQDAAKFNFDALMETESVAEKIHQIAGAVVQLRSYVTQIADYRTGLIERGVAPDARTFINLTSGSHWVWVVELQDSLEAELGRRCVIGEMVIDATTDERSTHVLMGLMPGHVYRWREPKRFEESQACGQTELYDSGCAIHSSALHGL